MRIALFLLAIPAYFKCTMSLRGNLIIPVLMVCFLCAQSACVACGVVFKVGVLPGQTIRHLDQLPVLLEVSLSSRALLYSYVQVCNCYPHGT